jgi:hypothetical protein
MQNLSVLTHALRYNLRGLDPNAVLFLAAAGIVNETQIQAVNTLSLDLKATGVWDKMVAIYPFVGGTADTHKYNLKDPRDLDTAYRITFTGAWNHTELGASGSSAYGDTKILPNTQMAFNNQSYTIYRGNTMTGGTDYGVNQDGALDNFGIFFGGTFNYSAINTFIDVGRLTGGPGPGTYTMTTSGGVKKVFKNNTLVGQNNESPVNYNLGTLFIGGRNEHGLGVRDPSNSQFRFFSVGDGLTDTEAANLYTAVQTFQTTLGRQV